MNRSGGVKRFVLLAALLQALALPIAAGATIPAGNLVVNPGAEIGPTSAIGERRPIPGWTTFFPGQPGFMAIDYLPSGDPGTLMHVDDLGASGCRAFFGGGSGTGSTAAFQTIDVSAAAPDIDAEKGNFMARLTARLGRLGTENFGLAKFEFLPATGESPNKVVELEDMSTGASRLETKSITTTVLEGTRRITVRILGIEEEGPTNTGYVDDVGLTLDGSDPAAATPPAGCKGGGATTGAASGITATTATVSGTVDPGLDLSNYRFQYGTTTAYGIASADQEIAPYDFGPYGPIPMLIPPSAQLTGLQPDTVYHYRLVAEWPKPGGSGFYTNPSLGADATFRTLPLPVGHRPRLSRSISINYAAAKERFRGKIASSTPACRRGRVKVFRALKGPDLKVASGRAAANGKWTAKKKVGDGRYYAKAAARTVDAGACPAVKSRLLKLG